jgi:hypothetical protein
MENTKIYATYIAFEDGSKQPVERIDYNAGLAWRRLKDSPDVVVCYEFRRGRTSMAQKVYVALDTAHKWASFDNRLDEMNHQLCEEALRKIRKK